METQWFILLIPEYVYKETLTDVENLLGIDPGDFQLVNHRFKFLFSLLIYPYALDIYVMLAFK